MNFPHAEIVAALEQAGCDFREISRSQHLGYIQDWIRVYGNLNTVGRRKLAGGRAIERAQARSSGNFLVVPYRDPAFHGWSPVGLAYDCRSERLPDLTSVSHYVDAFISPRDFKWTLMYGHEVDVFGGPHFSEADWEIVDPKGSI